MDLYEVTASPDDLEDVTQTLVFLIKTQVSMSEIKIQKLGKTAGLCSSTIFTEMTDAIISTTWTLYVDAQN